MRIAWRRKAAGALIGGGCAVAIFARVAPAQAQEFGESEVAEAPMITHIAIPRRQLNPEVTNVLDAFDIDNPFDLHVSAGWSILRQSSRIRRESNDPAVSSRGYLDTFDVADAVLQRQVLTFSAATALYHDLEIWVSLPLVLQDDRSLNYPAGGDQDAINCGLRDQPYSGPGLSCPGLPPAPPVPVPCSSDPSVMCEDQLFPLPFTSPQRSGLDYIAVGINWGPLNQERDDTKPTWVFGFEFRLPPPGGGPMVAGRAADSNASKNVSRFVWSAGLRSVFSHRYRYVAPFIGAFFRYDAPTPWGLYPAGRFSAQDNEGRLNRYPPLWGMMSFGVELIPWENVENFQRFGIELRADGIYTSEGRDYSELFDALGTSTHRGLHPCSTDASGNAVCVDDVTPNNRATGQTDVENYGIFRASLGLNIQAARYVKFTLRGAVSRIQDHIVTFTDACNPSASVSQDPCTSGFPNPDHRPVIDLPGRRFHVTGGVTWEATLLVAVML